MTDKMLHIDPQRCTGCMECEIVCAIRCSASANPSLSRIRIFQWNRKPFFIPTACRQCEDAPCMAACPRDALYRDNLLDRVMVDYGRCISCRMCMAACPFGAMGFDPLRQKIFKCDLCGGDPQCVRFCYPGALTYVPVERVQYGHIRHAARIRIGVKENGPWPISG